MTNVQGGGQGRLEIEPVEIGLRVIREIMGFR